MKFSGLYEAVSYEIVRGDGTKEPIPLTGTMFCCDDSISVHLIYASKRFLAYTGQIKDSRDDELVFTVLSASKLGMHGATEVRKISIESDDLTVLEKVFPECIHRVSWRLIGDLSKGSYV